MPDHNGSTTKSLTSPNDPRRLSSISSETSEAIIDDWSPATKDLLDALPQARIRGLLYLLIALTVTVLPWSMLSKVDETGKARGQLEPKDKTIQLDAPVTGKVAELKVEEGDFVKGGQVLLVLESDVTRAELEQLQTKKSGDQNRLSQLNSLKNQLIVSLRVQQLQNQTQQKEKSSQLLDPK